VDYDEMLWTDEAVRPQPFRIGFLRADPEAQLRYGVLHGIRDELLSRPAIKSAMAVENLKGIILLPSDSHQGLIQRMDRNEFDMVFCSSIDFVSQSGDYDALFQLRRPRDSFDPRGKRVFHRGQIFVNNRSPLFRDAITTSRLANLFVREEIAMVSSFSAAGYVYPCLKIASTVDESLPRGILFCDSSEEVVKYVINGVTEVGACDAGIIEAVLARNGLADRRDKLVRVVLETDPIPTDPVAIREKWLPRNSVFGRELRDALRQIFSRPEHRLPRLENSSPEQYEDLRSNLERFQELRR
jgi:ABC-type phosphate/phosphonate transport system substrate-binding protein